MCALVTGVQTCALPIFNFRDMIAAAPQLVRYEAYRSVYSIVSRYVRDDRLREALSFHTLLVGGNPMKTSAIYALIHALEKQGGVWFPRGGTHALVRGMVKLFEELGGTIRLGDPVERMETLGDRVTAIERSEEHTSELQSLMRKSYAVFCLKKKNNNTKQRTTHNQTT